MVNGTIQVPSGVAQNLLHGCSTNPLHPKMLSLTTVGKECRNVHGGFATPEYGHIPDVH